MRRQVQLREKEENMLLKMLNSIYELINSYLLIYFFTFLLYRIVQDEKAEGFVSLPEFKIDRASECRKK